MYQLAFKFLNKFFTKAWLFKHGFNLSPMYRRTVGKIKYVSKELNFVKVEIPLNYKNRNYVGAIFGGSLYAATDPIYMIQLMNILGDEYVVWDKAATIRYKQPAKEKAYAIFKFTEEEITTIKQRITTENEINLIKHVDIISKTGIIFAELDKTIYIASKAYYKHKLKLRNKK